MKRKRARREGRRAEQCSVSLSREVIEEIDRQVDAGEWKTRSDFIEKAVREALVRRKNASREASGQHSLFRGS